MLRTAKFLVGLGCFLTALIPVGIVLTVIFLILLFKGVHHG